METRRMHTPYGLDIVDNCGACTLRHGPVFCNLPRPSLQKLNDIRSAALYPKSAVLFMEGQRARGMFILCAGKAKLSASSRAGKTIITKFAGPGEVLGMAATISDRPYTATAEMVEPGQANFIPREMLLRFLGEDPDAALNIAQQLSRNYYTAYEEIRTLGLTNSPSERLAKLLLSWCDAGDVSHPAQVRLTLTHEEIAEMIGTTRETVSRLFSGFKKKQLLQVKGSNILIRNRAALERILEL